MPTVRVKLDEETFDEMKANAPAALQDPEMIRHYVSLGMMFQIGRNGPTEEGGPDTEEDGLDSDS